MFSYPVRAASRAASSPLLRAAASGAIRTLAAGAGQAEVVLVGCGAPDRGMGWYHAVQMLEGR